MTESYSLNIYFHWVDCHFLYEVENNYHKSSCTQVYYQAGVKSTKNNMLVELFTQIISEPCFNILRTKEQLGYIVFSGIRRNNGVQGIRIIVQSNKHPQFVEDKIDEFLDSMEVSFEYFMVQFSCFTVSKILKLYFSVLIAHQQHSFQDVRILSQLYISFEIKVIFQYNNLVAFYFHIVN